MVYCAKRTLPPLHIGTRRSSVLLLPPAHQSVKSSLSSGTGVTQLLIDTLNKRSEISPKSSFLDQFQTRLTLGVCGFKVPEKCIFSGLRTSFKLDLRLVSVVSGSPKVCVFRVSGPV